MIALLLAVMAFCPLLSQGVGPANVSMSSDGAMSADFVAYVFNPSSFSFSTSRVDVWVRDREGARTAHAVPEGVPKTTVLAHTDQFHAVILHFFDTNLDLYEAVGSSVECDGVQ